MIAVYILCALNLLSLILFSHSRYKNNKSVSGFVYKAVASILFVIIAVVSTYVNVAGAYAVYIITALVCGMIGDIFLAVPEFTNKNKTLVIISGGLAFLSGHIFYVVCFISQTGFNWAIIISALALTAFLLLIIRITGLKIAEKKLLPAMAVYVILISTVVTSACYYFLKSNYKINSIFAMIGSILFLVSDICLVYSYFYKFKDKRKICQIVYFTYYPAQILLALSIAFI